MNKTEKITTTKGIILIIEDENHLREGLADFLLNRGFEVYAAENGARAFDYLEKFSVDLILTDMKMKGIANLPLIDTLIEKAPDVQIVVMTAYGTVKEAVEAMKRGVYDYLTKPVNLDELLLCLEKALEKKRLSQEVSSLRQELQSRYCLGNILGKSRKMQDIYNKIQKVAETNATVLILGESGTGKEMVARAIHFNSLRKNGPFVTLTCASIPDSLLASELFGYEKGAFTGAYGSKLGKFESANEGTLFIDDVADIGMGLQIGLLRFLQDREFERVGGNETIKANVRVIAASHRDLYKEVKEGKFREDLYYRLNVFPIYLPPLKERKEDIPLLAEHFVKKYCRENNKKIKGLTTEAMLTLMSYTWPGNVRELEHLIERAVIMVEGSWINSSEFSPQITRTDSADIELAFGTNLQLSENFKYIEKYLIARALEESHGSRTVAAEKLGITYRALRYKMKKYNLD